MTHHRCVLVKLRIKVDLTPVRGFIRGGMATRRDPGCGEIAYSEPTGGAFCMQSNTVLILNSHPKSGGRYDIVEHAGLAEMAHLLQALDLQLPGSFGCFTLVRLARRVMQRIVTQFPFPVNFPDLYII